MAYTFEFDDGRVRAWALTDAGATPRWVDYEPTIFVHSEHPDALAWLADVLAADPKVTGVREAERFTSLHDAHRDTRREVLAVTLERVGEVRTLAREIRANHERESFPVGTFRLFDVDLDPGFRFCLDRGIDPQPTARPLRSLAVGLDEKALAERDVGRLRIDGEPAVDDGSAAGEAGVVAALEALRDALARRDPDVLVLRHGDLVPVLAGAADECGVDLQLGRRPGWERLAGESTYHHYGQVGYSPSRYRVPGRAIVDRSNSFLWHQSGLGGLVYMVGRSRRPLQETARASIGGILTSMQIADARERGVLAPWNKWEPERFTDVSTLHAADRGGFTFAPEVGFHEDVHEIDFASLYPRIIREYNVSPETVDCGCPDAVDGVVPELDYAVCERDGFLPAVLAPLLSDRRARKARLRELEGATGEGSDDGDGETDGGGNGGETDGTGTGGETDGDGRPTAGIEDEAARLRAESGAIKWVLVSCFGYQGYRNAKFGRIECHEAINAHAREIMLTAKERLEAGGWHVVHGIVDSLWVTPVVDDPEPLERVTADVSATVGIELEREGRFEWVCFVPLRGARGGGAAGRRTPGGRPAGGRTAGGRTAGGRTAGGRTTEERTAGGRAGRRGGARGGTDGPEGGPIGAGAALSTAPAGALTKYFGKRADGSYKFRGVEVRQRSTPAFVADCQREFVETLDATRDPAAVCARLERRLGELRRGAVDPADLLVTKRVSKELGEYRQRTHTVAALQRYDRHDVPRRPGQSVHYLVADDDATRNAERVRLGFELDDGAVDEAVTAVPRDPPYDVEHYAELLVRAAESVCSPLGWDAARIRRAVADGEPTTLSAFADE